MALGHEVNFRIAVHDRVDEYISREISEFGQWEPLETELFSRLLREEVDFYDIGANIGWYTLVAASLLRRHGGMVHSFEPVWDNFLLLDTNVRANAFGNVRVNPVALGNRCERVTMYLSPTNRGDHRLFDDGSERSVEQMTMLRFDQYYLPSKRNVIVKMDTQGAEAMVIAGMGDLLSQMSGLIMLIEFWPFGLSNNDTDATALIDMLSTSGFKPAIVSEGEPGLRLTDWRSLAAAAQSTLAPKTEHFVNLLLWREDSSISAVEDLFRADASHLVPAISERLD